MPNDITPAQVKAARALLAWSQQELAAAARVSESTVADFERAARTPVPNNAAAIREALEAKEFNSQQAACSRPAPPPALPQSARAPSCAGSARPTWSLGPRETTAARRSSLN